MDIKVTYGPQAMFGISYAESEVERLRAENARLLENAKQDAGYLAAYHYWCQVNNCAPSSSDLIAALDALAEKGEK